MIITVSNPTGANAGPDTTICSNANPIQLPAGTWTGSPNISPTGLYTPTSAMVDDVIVTQGNGSCATTDTTIVTILPVPKVLISMVPVSIVRMVRLHSAPGLAGLQHQL
jgi:hypothetical protein